MPVNRNKAHAMWRGARQQCPACGKKSIFSHYLKVRETCQKCGLYLAGHQADDAPPYFTMFIVSLVIVPLALLVEREFAPPLYVQASALCLLAILLSLFFLPIVKGAIIGLQWALHLHGFDDHDR